MSTLGIHTPSSPPAGEAPPAAKRSVWQQLLIAARIARVRLRFILVFVVLFLVVGERELIHNYWDKWTGSTSSRDTTAHAVSLDTEYFCPMDPGVVSDWSGKCGICK